LSFQNRLKNLRKDLGLKQLEMAVQLKVSLSTLQRYESGYSFPDLRTLEIIAALGVDLHWLVTGELKNQAEPRRLSVDEGAVYFAFRSDDFSGIKATLDRAGMSVADLYFTMDKYLNGVIDGLKSLNEKPF